MTLSIVIVSYKTCALLQRCLQSIYDASLPFPFETIVVDNNSSDGSPEMVRKNFPQVNLIDNKQNLGYSVANNQGIAESTGELILLLNPDTEVNRDAIEGMTVFLQKHTQAAVAGCQLVFSDGTPQTSWFHFPMPLSRSIEHRRWYPRLAHFLLGISHKNPEIKGENAQCVDIIKGACMMIRRGALNDVGLFDENAFLYADDNDWCLRARRRGWDAYFLPSLTILHHGWASTDQEPFLTIVNSRRSALYFHRKHYNWFLVLIWTFLIYLEILYKFLLNALRYRLRRNDEKIRERYRAYAFLAREIFKLSPSGQKKINHEGHE
ncbi:MAG: glycosyltransferase family 2 protein [bacterium]